MTDEESRAVGQYIASRGCLMVLSLKILMRGFLGRTKIFWKPKKTPILIRASTGITPVSKLFLENSFTIFEVGGRTISVKVLIRALLDRRNLPFGKKYFAHYVAETEALAVFSNVNHSGGLSGAALVNPEVITVSFQNGVRGEVRREAYSQGRITSGREVAFGFEAEELKWFHESLEIERLIYATGSLKSNLVPIEKTTPSTLGVVFPSQWRPKIQRDEGRLSYQGRFSYWLLPHLASWCRIAGFSLTILGATTETLEEKSFYDKILGAGTYEYIARNPGDWKVGYNAVDRAELVVSIASSLGIEAIARGKKTLFYLMSEGTPEEGQGFSPVVASCPIGPFWVHDGDLIKARKLFFDTLRQTEEDYFEAIEKNTRLRFGSDEGLFETRRILLRIIPQLHPWIREMNTPVF